ncbi:MAG: nicotinate-nucleotide adenylyltransferase [Chloroflexota bacterium]
MTARVGILGGTFDPPHLGHLILASEALTQLHLTRLLWVLTALPPHKLENAITPVEDRSAMLRLALAGETAFELSTVDIDRPGPHYTLDTVRLLKDQNPGDEMILVLGGDSLRDLPDWHRPAELVAACAEIGVMRRPGDEIDLSALEARLPGLTAKVRFVDAPLLEISSHEIRERVRRHQPFKYYVTPAVHEFILSHGVYRTG